MNEKRKSPPSRWWALSPILVGFLLLGVGFVLLALMKSESVKVVERVVHVPVEVGTTVDVTPPTVMTTDYRSPTSSEVPSVINRNYGINISGTGNSVVIVTGESGDESVASIVEASKRTPAHCIETRRQYEATLAKWETYFE